MKRWVLLTALWGASVLSGEPARGAEVLVVLSAGLKAYAEALAGFQKTYGGEVDVCFLNKKSPAPGKDTRVVVAFGGKAALQSYPPGTRLIYALAPGVNARDIPNRRDAILVEMTPRPEGVLDVIRGLQPALQNLAVYHVSNSFDPYVQTMREAAQVRGIRIQESRVENVDDLPMRLRAVRGKTHALWILPDPLLINPQTIAILNDFSWANDIPLYVPIEGLPDRGAVAAIAVDFDRIGKEAARAARAVLSGGAVDRVLYPEEVSLVIHAGAAKTIGLEIPKFMREKAKAVLP
jgi:hypothetical protein